MKKVRVFNSILAIILCCAMILPCVPMGVFAAPLDNFDSDDGYAGLNMSIIGDSISTYEGVTNNSTYNPLYLSTSEATFGTYYGDSTRTDYADYDQVKWKDTWWQQTIDTLGMNLLVNNAWSGSYVLKDSAKDNSTEYGAAAYKARSVNLHNGTKTPDIIAVYLGTNDVANYSSTSVGSKADVDTASERNSLFTSVNSYATPSTSVAAYYIMISRMIAKYPNAEIYCMLPSICLAEMSSGRSTALNNFNTGVKYIVDYYAGLGKKVYLVDLNNDCGLVNNDTVKDHYYANNVHPDVDGMDWITNCLISEILEHSSKGVGTSESYEVTYNLTDCYSKEGLIRRAIKGKSLNVNLLPYSAYEDVKLTVTMQDAVTGERVEIPCDGVDGDGVYIPEVVGPVTVTATASKNVANYQWIAGSEAISSAVGNGFEYNRNTLMGGTYTPSTDGGTCTDLYYSLQAPVVLEYDKPWELEFKGGGDTYAGGIMLMSTYEDSTTSGNLYIHINQTYVLFGYRDSNGYNNSGISWADIAQKMGSSAGADYRKEIHVFRFVNEPNGTNNKLYLYVDGVKIGSMDSAKLVGGSTTHSAAGSINISGKDFVFNYIAASAFPLRNCSLSYIKVWENGEANMNVVTQQENHRWELSANGNSFVSVEGENFVKNGLSLKAGSVFGGEFTGTYFKMDKQVVLMHDKQWSVEWVSDGSWIDSRNGGMLLSSTECHNDLNSYYLYRRHNSTFIALGEWKDGVHNNYGCSLSDNGIDGTVSHKYALVNEITEASDGTYASNMVYLYVDDVKVGPMNHYYSGGTDMGTTSNWVNGRDFCFSYVGTQAFTVGACNLEYLQITTACIHEYEAVITAPTCTEAGYTTHTCTKCGEYYIDDTVDATGHSYQSAVKEPTCTEDGYTTHTCSVCGHNYTDSNVAAVGHSWTDATCTTAKTCTVCGTVEGDVAEHLYQSTVTAPTCTAEGYTTHICFTCGHTQKDSIVAATGHSYTNGVCSACGAEDPDYIPPIIIPTLSLVAPALNFEDEIYYNIYYTVSDMTDVVQMGLITFNSNVSDGTVDNADAVIPGYVPSGSNYMSHTNGIPAKMLGDALYFKAYAKLSDGTYVYSNMAPYHAVAYAKDILANSSNVKMKALVVAMLNYGAAAQVHFDYKTDSLVNSFLSEDQKALVDTYSADMVEGLTKVDTSKVGGFVSNGGYNGIAPNVVFEGAFAINLYFTPANVVNGNVELYYWTVDDYNAASILTSKNASGVVITEETATSGRYMGTISGIAAKQIDQTVFFAAIYESDGVYYSTGVFSYSLASYCLDRVANGSATMQEFAKETIVYGYYAKAYFA